jgi:hypothetical protein
LCTWTLKTETIDHQPIDAEPAGTKSNRFHVEIGIVVCARRFEIRDKDRRTFGRRRRRTALRERIGWCVACYGRAK